MRLLIALLVIVYLVGIGTMLAPTFKAKWSSGTPSELAASVIQDLPAALAWPATLYRSLAGPTGSAPSEQGAVKP